MNLRTEITVPKSDITISHQSVIMSMGSCFAENIGNRMASLKFDIDVNPFGILYNPASIANSLKLLFECKKFNEDDVFFYNDVWSSLYHHSSFSGIEKDNCLKKINTRLESASKRIKKCDILFITFGTAQVYKHIVADSVVSNCHKLPAHRFHKYRLSVKEIVDTYKTIIDQLRIFNPNIKIIFSVSPIRHWKDGAHENQLSKSTLLLAIDEICKYSDTASYFPSYELVLDDLRDYRFYENDMLHPNSIAIEYIWEQIISCYFSKNTLELVNKIKRLVAAKNHRPFNPNTEAHQNFLKTHYEKTEELHRTHSYLSFKEELEYFGMWRFIK